MKPLLARAYIRNLKHLGGTDEIGYAWLVINELYSLFLIALNIAGTVDFYFTVYSKFSAVVPNRTYLITPIKMFLKLNSFWP